MFATISSLTLIPLVLCVGVFVPLLGLHLELVHRRDARHQAKLDERARVIEDHEATIQAYRQVMALEMNGLESSPIRVDS